MYCSSSELSSWTCIIETAVAIGPEAIGGVVETVVADSVAVLREVAPFVLDDLSSDGVDSFCSRSIVLRSGTKLATKESSNRHSLWRWGEHTRSISGLMPLFAWMLEVMSATEMTTLITHFDLRCRSDVGPKRHVPAFTIVRCRFRQSDAFVNNGLKLCSDAGLKSRPIAG